QAGHAAAVEELLQQNGVESEVEPEAAVLLGNARAEHAGFGACEPELAVDHALLFPASQMRNELTVEEAAKLIAEQTVVRGEGGSPGCIEHSALLALATRRVRAETVTTRALRPAPGLDLEPLCANGGL